METSQQFHLKWNNHSLNTLSSFQQLLDTNTLVDVSLTCCNGKTVTAHRMVLAACSQYFYRLFKELPEKHPVIVFKDANEEIVRDLLLFMYKGEVEVQESHLNDFLKFADTLQVKGLSQSDRAAAAQTASSLDRGGSEDDEDPKQQLASNTPVSSAKMEPVSHSPIKSSLPDMTKSYLAGLAKFPSLFPLPAEPSPADLLTHLSSPNLYRALHNRKFGGAPGHMGKPEGLLPPGVDNPMLKNMPFLNLLYPHHPGASIMRDDNDNDTDRSVTPPQSNPPPAHQSSSGSRMDMDENGLEGSSPMEGDYHTPPPSNQDHSTDQHRDSDSSSEKPSKNRGGSKPAAGRGSRLERMIAAEYKIMSEYAEQNQDLPVMTPELMKSRRTHSLQLAIGEILHNRASVQSAATKYHIPRETLRRHYQRYLKAMGIQSTPPSKPGSASSSASSTVRTAVATNNNAPKLPMDTSSSADESSNGFSSLLDIGQAYGLWNNPDLDALRKKEEARQMQEKQEKEEKEKELIIDEDEKEDVDVVDDDEEDKKESTEKIAVQEELSKSKIETMSA